MVGGSIVQKKTGSGTSTPDSITSLCSLSFFSPPASVCARRAAAAAEALDDTMVSPVTVFNDGEQEKTNEKKNNLLGVVHRGLLYLFESYSHCNVPCSHRGDFYMLISKWHQQPSHPFTAHNKVTLQ